MKITNKFGLPDSIVRAVKNDQYHRGSKADISVTQLIDPPRKIAIEGANANKLEEDAIDRIWSLLGQAVHTILERAETKAITEERLYMNIDGWIISGQMDRIDIQQNGGGVKLDDYKVTSSYAVKNNQPKPEWVAQQNCYAQLLRENGYQVDGLRVVAILRDWSKLNVLRDPNYPKHQIATIKIPLWSEQDAKAYMEARVRLHKEARIGLPLCTEEEKWTKPSKFAVMKTGRKSALRLLDSQSAAEAWAKANGHMDSVGNFSAGFRIDHRRGEDIRCASYCAAAPFCSQWNKLLV